MKAGWKTAQLSEIAELSGRIGWKGLTAKEYTQEGPFFLSVHSLNYGDFVDFRDAFHISQPRYDESPEIMLQIGDVLICKDGAGIGKVGIVGELPGPTTINSSLLLVRASGGVDSKYLYYILMSPYFQSIVQSRLEGATTPHLYQRDIAGFPIHLPRLEEQRQIVSVLDKAFAGIANATANTQKSIANARALFEAELDEIFSKRGMRWSGLPLNEVGKTVTGNTPKTGDAKNFGDFLPFIKPGNFLQDGSLEYDRDGLSEIGAQSSRIVPAGSALMVCIGATIGKSGYTERTVTANQQINAVIPKKGIVGKFLYYQFLTPAFQRSVRHGSGQATLPIINKSKWSGLTVKIPDSEKEQQSIVASLDKISSCSQQLVELGKRKIGQLEELKQSLLQKAFAGELT